MAFKKFLTVRKSIYETKTQMLKLNSERDKAAMAKVNLPVPKGKLSPRGNLLSLRGKQLSP